MLDEKREAIKKTLKTADVIILEGTLIFTNPGIRNLIDLKIFLDTDEDIRLSRKVYRDVCLRNKNLNDVLDKYLKYIKKGFDKYTLPSKKYADIIIPDFGGGYSSDFVDLGAGFSTLESAALDLVTN